MTMQAYLTKDTAFGKKGEPVALGGWVVNFRGETAFFVKVVREPQGNSSGRIAAIRPGKDWPEDVPVTLETLMEDQRVNAWNERLSRYDEVFPSVYDLVIR